MPRSLAIVGMLTVLGASPGAASDFVMIGKPGKVETGFIGCRDKEDLSRIKALFRAGDKDAAVKYALRKVPDCRAFSEGTTGMVEDNSVWSSATCLRPKGEPDCFWLPMPFVVAP